jgi:hypothetical protein
MCTENLKADYVFITLNANIDNLNQTLAKIRELLTSKDLLYFYYGGHGV